ncbi:MAG: methyl-accepting chemotaxis protein [Desulfovibrio sp.]|uniref:methyl-accepting chemotaxis protein n=1 Tax=Desulfovibrio sp. 7SRBS1 TaxID=3378064 RepID=UPI003B426727
MRSLSSKFLIPTLVLIIVCLFTMSSLVYRKSVNSSSAAAESLNDAKLANTVSLIDIWLDGLEQKLAAISKLKEIVDSASNGISDKEAQREAVSVLKDMVGEQNIVPRMNLMDINGIVTASSQTKSIGNNYSDRAYFKAAAAGSPYLSNVIIGRTSGAPVLMASHPVKKDGKVVGVVSLVIEISAFAKKFIDNITIGKTGYIYIASDDGLVIVHQDKKLIAKLNLVNEFEWGRELVSKGDGVVEYDYNGKSCLTYFTKSEKTGWIICSTAPVSEFFSESRSIGIFIISSAIVIMFVIGLGVFFILKMNVIVPVKGIVDVASKISEGDLETNLQVDRNDEIGLLQTSLLKMVERLREMIASAEEKTELAREESQKAQIATQEAEEARKQAERAKAEGMLAAANHLEGIVEQITSASEELSSQIEESARGSQIQRERTSESATAMEEMNASVLEVAQNASQAAESAMDAKDQAEDGGKIVGDVVASIDSVNEASVKMVEGLNGLGDQAEDISKVVTVITDIADQTNLLALNAAIEAARAGEAGRGFAVVADEVRKLAEKTMKATQEVEQSVRGIQSVTRTNIEEMDNAAKLISQSKEYAGRAGESLQIIVENVESTADQVRAIATASEEQSAASEQINRSSDEVNRIAMETSEAMQQSMSAVSDLARLTGDLQKLIDELKDV